jgi:FdhD protein
MPRPDSTTEARVWAVDARGAAARTDSVATEEPLEIRLRAAPAPSARALPLRTPAPAPHRAVAITMRTPGADLELAVGFLHGEGILRHRDDIARVGYCDSPEMDDERRANVVTVDLNGPAPDLGTLERHFLTTSACGVCGKASLDALRVKAAGPIPDGPPLEPGVLRRLPAALREAQGLFAATGGLHAAALFDGEGGLIALREDVGRHNAVDKLIGWALLEGRLPLHHHLLMVSGRSSFEIVQKCVMAGVPALCAVSAPSSLAVSVAREFGMTLVGFLRGDRFNVYAGVERVRLD